MPGPQCVQMLTAGRRRPNAPGGLTQTHGQRGRPLTRPLHGWPASRFSNRSLDAVEPHAFVQSFMHACRPSDALRHAAWLTGIPIQPCTRYRGSGAHRVHTGSHLELYYCDMCFIVYASAMRGSLQVAQLVWHSNLKLQHAYAVRWWYWTATEQPP